MEKLVIGILAHVDAGKTTLSEGILYLTGKIRKLGRVDHKDAYLDTYNLERVTASSCPTTLLCRSVSRFRVFSRSDSLNLATGDRKSVV